MTTQILDAALRLFAANGYTATSTRQIAAEVGLRQGSLVHYFGRKQDILVELVRRSLRPAFDHAAELALTGLPTSVQFYRFVHSDCLSLCEDELNTASLLLQPDIRNLAIDEAHQERERLVGVYEELIARGRDEGTFAADDVRFAAKAAIGVVESVAFWFERGSRADSEACADHLAAMITAGLLADNRELARIIDLAVNAAPAPEA